MKVMIDRQQISRGRTVEGDCAEEGEDCIATILRHSKLQLDLHMLDQCLVQPSLPFKTHSEVIFIWRLSGKSAKGYLAV